MTNNTLILISIIIIALGTYLTRALPLFIDIEKRLDHHKKLLMRHFFHLMGAAIIAALFATSIDISAFSIGQRAALMNMISGFIGIIISYKLFKNSGISVLAGLVFYLASSLALTAFFPTL
ncbi:MAG: AzlD domain-containing protein [Cocleimonas sp.]|nr:AzlD domain-containing protein [Cocleimonas sp.]